MDFETIEPQTWQPENDGDTIEGVLVKKEVDVGVNKSKLYHLDTKDKGQISFWGSAVLDNRLDYVNEGDFIRVTYKGIKKNKRNQDTKIFKVERSITKTDSN